MANTIHLYREVSERLDFSFEVKRLDDGRYALTWSDMVVNDWTEIYPSLSIVVARLAVLIALGEEDWTSGFENDQDEFALSAEMFLSYEAALHDYSHENV